MAFIPKLVIKEHHQLEFEDGLRTVVLPGGCWYPCCGRTQDQFCTTREVRVGHGGGVVVIRTPVRPNSNSAEFRTWVVLNHSSYEVLG